MVLIVLDGINGSASAIERERERGGEDSSTDDIDDSCSL
jgi:hypothetical protein